MQVPVFKPVNVLTSSALLNLFEQELSYILWTEKAQNEMIIQLLNKASAKELRDALFSHKNSFKEQFQNIETAFNMIKKPVVERKCEAIIGLIKKAEILLVNARSGSATDLQIISVVQKIKQQQKVSYNLLCVFATTLRFDNASLLLYENLEHVTNFDRLLTVIAEYIIDFARVEQ